MSYLETQFYTVDIVRPKFIPAGWDRVKDCKVIRIDEYGFVYVDERPDFGYLDILFEKVECETVKVNLPPIGSGAYLGIDKMSLRNRGIKYSDVEIELTYLQLYVIQEYVRGAEINLIDLWAGFGARKVSPILGKWFEECLDKVRGNE